MECFKCERTQDQVLLIKLPVDIAYDEVYFEIVGNYRPNEHICLPCVGYIFDELSDSA